METEPAESHDSNPPHDSSDTTEEPVRAVPTIETTPVWAQTQPAPPPEDSHEPDDADIPDEAEPVVPPTITPQARAVKGDPDWSKPESSSNGDNGKTTPEWARTVPTDPGEPVAEEVTTDRPPGSEDAGAQATEPPEESLAAEPPEESMAAEPREESMATEPPVESMPTEPPVAMASEPPEDSMETEPQLESMATESPDTEAAVTEPSFTDPPRSVAADAMKSTWPPASESAPAPPEETDIWPPEPPTEHAMPAWPPPSELEEPVSPAQAIPSWPDSFDPVPQVPAAASTPSPGVSAPGRFEPKPVEAKALAPPAPPTLRTPPTLASSPTPPAPAAPPATTRPVAPAQPGPPSRPEWAPKLAAETVGEVPQAKPATPINVPAWAPRVPLAAEPGTPTWFSPKEQIPHTTAQPAAQSIPAGPAPQPTPPSPIPPIAGGQLPVAKVPPTPAQPAQPAQPATAKPSWEVVDQPRKSGPHGKADAGPTAEDRSYAEWFAWAKRGGAPASACHAAAQGAFKALSSGKDVTTAVQWATAAMSRPPENVSYTRQTYCAWFSLANIDLNLDQHRAHAFAMAAVHVLDAGQDAAAAHAAGLAAAGIR